MTMIAAEAGAGRAAAQEAAVRRQLAARADQISTRVPAPGSPPERPKPSPAPEPASAPDRTASTRPEPQERGQGRDIPGMQKTAGQFTSPSFHNYQGIILVEFILAELLVAATPFAKKGQPGLSPYAARDMTKMLAIGLLYFLLELSAVGNSKWGRYGAWFGGLVLLVAGINEAANVSKVFNIFGKPPAAGEGSAGPVPPAPQTGSTTNPPGSGG